MINRFNGEYKFLSNFYPSTIRVDGLLFKTVEHAFQASKTNNFDEKQIIKNAISPSQAKKFGKTVTLRDDWDDVKVQIMMDLLKQKFENPFLRCKLIATDNIPLIEGNSWHDNFWGSCRCGKCNDGLNVLGKLLMNVREQALLEEQSVDN